MADIIEDHIKRLRSSDPVTADVLEILNNRNAQLERLRVQCFENAYQWMKWCDSKVLERAEVAEAELRTLKAKLEGYKGHLDSDCEVARGVGWMCTCRTEQEKAQDLTDLQEENDRLKAEMNGLIAMYSQKVMSHDAAMKELSPAPNETLLVAIRNLRQAYLTEKDNAAYMSEQVGRLTEALKSVHTALSLVNKALDLPMRDGRDETIASIEQWLQWGEDAAKKGQHGGYFSGGGWAATLRKHLESLK